MNIDEPQTYERVGAAAGLVGIFIGLSKLGLFRPIIRWWREPSRDDLMRIAIDGLTASQHKLAATQDRQCEALEHINANMLAISDNFVIAEAMTRAMADRDPTPMFQCSLPDGKCVWTNKALQALFGRTREQMLGNGWAESIVPSHQDRVINGWKYSAVNSDIYNCDYPIERDGKLVNVRAHADFIIDNTGRKLIAIGTIKVMPTIIDPDE